MFPKKGSSNPSVVITVGDDDSDDDTTSTSSSSKEKTSLLSHAKANNDLISNPHETQNCYSKFIYWLSKVSLLERLTLFTVLKRRNVLTDIELSKVKSDVEKCCACECGDYVSWCCWFKKHIWPSKNGMPATNGATIARAIKIRDFFAGINDFTEAAWPLAFCGLFLHDILCHYLYPENRYGTTGVNIFLGTSNNQQTLTAYLTENWWYTPLLAVLPIGFGIYRAIVNRSKKAVISEQNIKAHINWYNNFGMENDSLKEVLEILKTSSSRSGFSSLSPLWQALDTVKYLMFWERSGKILVNHILTTKEHRALTQHKSRLTKTEYPTTNETLLKKQLSSELVTSINRSTNGQFFPSELVISPQQLRTRNHKQFQPDIPEEPNKKQQLYYYVLQTIYKHKHLTRLSALSILADIADITNNQDAQKLKNIGIDNNEVDILLDLHHRALKKLHEFAKFNLPDPRYASEDNLSAAIRYIYTNYLLWKLGEKTKPAFHPLFWSFKIALLYAKIRLFTTLVQFSIDKINWALNWRDCVQEGKQWQYMQQAGEYQCTVCGDWSNVYYKHTNSSQDCLTDYTSIPHTTTELTQAVSRLQRFGFTKINLSQQNVSSWSFNEFWHVLTNVSSATNHTLDSFGFYRDQLSQPPLRANFTIGLANFFADMQVKKIDLHKLITDPADFTSLLNNMNAASVEELNFSYIPIDELVAENLLSILPRFTSLKILRLSNNGINDAQIKIFAPALAVLSIETLDLSNNFFGQEGLDVLAQNLPPRLTELDLGNNDFGSANLTMLGTNLPNYPLRTLIFTATKVNDENIADLLVHLPKSSLSNINLSTNKLTDRSAVILKVILPNTNITVINLSQNEFTAISGPIFGSMLTNSSIVDFDISYNDLTDEGLSELAQYFYFSSIKKLNISGNQLTAFAMSDFAKSLANSTAENVDLSGNYIGDTGFVNFLQELSKRENKLRILHFASSQLNSNSMDDLRIVLQTGLNITQLNLSGNNIGDVGIAKLIPAFSNSTINTFTCTSCSITTQGITIFSQVVHNAANLYEVCFDNNDIDNAGALSLSQALIPSSIPHQDELGNVKVSRDQMRAITLAESNTDLRFMSLAGANISDTGRRAICRVLPASHIEFGALNFNNNPVALANCWTSSANRLAVPFYFSPNAISQSVTTNLQAICHEANEARYALLDFLGDCFAFIRANAPCGINTILEFSGSVLLAFRQEIYAAVIKRLPQRTQETIEKFTGTDESILLHEMSIFALRHKFAGHTTLVYDVVTSVKVSQQSSNMIITKDTQNPSLSERCGEAARSLVMLAGTYGIAYAVATLSGNPLLGYVLTPVALKSKQIVSVTMQSYRKHGFFAAAWTAFEEFAYTAPGGELIRKSLYANSSKQSTIEEISDESSITINNQTKNETSRLFKY